MVLNTILKEGGRCWTPTSSVMRFVPVYAMGIILISGLLVAAQGQPKAGLTCMQRVFGLAKDCPSEPIDGSEPNDPRVMRCCAAVEMINDNECTSNESNNSRYKKKKNSRGEQEEEES